MAAAQTDESGYFSDLPTVLSASRLPQPLDEVPGAVTVLDRDLIQATGYRDLARLLRLVPGLQVAQSRGGRSWVTYHGMSPASASGLQVLIDGRSVATEASFDGIDWAALPVTIDEIERIEVVRGPNPVSFGANAFMGSVNIITRDSASDPGVRARVSLGHPGVRDVSLGGNGQFGAVSVRLDGAVVRDEGFSDLRDRHEVAKLAVRADSRLSNDDELIVRVGGSSSTSQEGYAGTVFNNNAERDADHQSAFAHLQWNHAKDSGSEWRVDFYHNQDTVNDQWAVLRPAFGALAAASVPVNRDRQSSRDNLEFHHRVNAGDNGRLIWGAELRADRIESAFMFSDPATDTSMTRRLFGDVEWKFAPRWQLTMGASAEKTDAYDPHLSPRIFLNWKAADEHAWRMGFSRVWQQDDLFLRKVDIRIIENGRLLAQPYIPNPDLRPARFDNAELGYFGRFPALGVTLDARVFHERAHDYIYSVPVRSPLPLASLIGTAQFQNYDKPVTLTGVEYELKAHVWQGGDLRLTHTVTRRDSGNWEIDHLTAPYVVSLSWLQSYRGGWSSTLTGYRMGPTIGGDTTGASSASMAPAYFTADARVAYAFGPVGNKWEVSLNAINLGGRHAEMAGRVVLANGGSMAVGRASPMVYLGLRGEF